MSCIVGQLWLLDQLSQGKTIEQINAEIDIYDDDDDLAE